MKRVHYAIEQYSKLVESGIIIEDSKTDELPIEENKE
jgi:hypothetical protein